jgi:small subunit ribosomal protein S19e
MSRQIFQKEPQAFVKNLAEALKGISEFQTPDWALFVKSGVSKQRPPENDDFWFFRTASILRQLYIKGVVGVSRLRTRYGSRKNRGSEPAKFRKASGKIIRTILQQAEKAGLVEKVTGQQFGRRLTSKGREFLDSIKA